MRLRLFPEIHLKQATHRSCRAIACLVCLLPGSALAYRTAGDLPDFDGTERVRWAGDRIHYRLFAGTGSYGQEAVETTMQEALDEWGAQECGQISFDYGGITLKEAAPNDGVNTVQLIFDDWSERGYDPSAGGVTDVQYEKRDGGWVISEADLYVNAQHFTWITDVPSSSDERSLRGVFLHEGGHMLGLLHPCEAGGREGAPACTKNDSYIDSAMYPFYGTGGLRLERDDRRGLCFLYPGALCGVQGCPFGSECTDDGCRASCNGSICGEEELCLADTCVAPEDFCSIVDCGQCETSSDCRNDLNCVEGVCATGTAPNGDPCTGSRDCSSSICVNETYCAASCVRDADCQTGDVCEGQCGGSRKPLGDPCAESNECIGDVCLGGYTERPVCTRECEVEDSPCPAGWLCESVETRRVCRPDTRDDGCGCAVPGRVRSLSTPWLTTTVLMLAVYCRRYNRVRVLLR